MCAMYGKQVQKMEGGMRGMNNNTTMRTISLLDSYSTPHQRVRDQKSLSPVHTDKKPLNLNP